jgi:hypothetical protein
VGTAAARLELGTAAGQSAQRLVKRLESVETFLAGAVRSLPLRHDLRRYGAAVRQQGLAFAEDLLAIDDDEQLSRVARNAKMDVLQARLFCQAVAKRRALMSTDDVEAAAERSVAQAAEKAAQAAAPLPCAGRFHLGSGPF